MNSFRLRLVLDFIFPHLPYNSEHIILINNTGLQGEMSNVLNNA